MPAEQTAPRIKKASATPRPRSPKSPACPLELQLEEATAERNQLHATISSLRLMLCEAHEIELTLKDEVAVCRDGRDRAELEANKVQAKLGAFEVELLSARRASESAESHIAELAAEKSELERQLFAARGMSKRSRSRSDVCEPEEERPAAPLQTPRKGPRAEELQAQLDEARAAVDEQHDELVRLRSENSILAAKYAECYVELSQRRAPELAAPSPSSFTPILAGTLWNPLPGNPPVLVGGAAKAARAAAAALPLEVSSATSRQDSPETPAELPDTPRSDEVELERPDGLDSPCQFHVELNDGSASMCGGGGSRGALTPQLLPTSRSQTPLMELLEAEAEDEAAHQAEIGRLRAELGPAANGALDLPASGGPQTPALGAGTMPQTPLCELWRQQADMFEEVALQVTDLRAELDHTQRDLAASEQRATQLEAGAWIYLQQLFGACRRRTPRAGSSRRAASDRSR